ncbi:MarR family winged helix-turn-helix transcriptional regulator [Paenibacillus massiliensis]|uniref:MarR family winged helix-turn-helix transcriptional regulator n=1 Tax=Paenibacillus massiliensis TaxID=225917 RepID=UPI0003654D6C|nr:MarR family transcriptional regulator [Paenibacillus massiliensis]
MSTNHSNEAVEVVDLLIRANRYVQQEYQVQLESLKLPFQLSGARLRLLLRVWHAEKIRMTELASKLGVKPRTVTELVDALEREGLIFRMPDPKDRRAVILQLTNEAFDQVNRVRIVQKEISENLLQNFSEEQRTKLIELLSIFFEGKEFESIF